MGRREMGTDGIDIDREVVLQTLDYYISQTWADCVFARQSLRLETWKDIALRQMCTSLFTSILAEEVERQSKNYTFHFFHHYQVPASWWQHFKMQCFPSWLRRKFPARMEARTISATERRRLVIKKYATYPKANIDAPQLGDAVYKFTILEEA